MSDEVNGTGNGKRRGGRTATTWTPEAAPEMARRSASACERVDLLRLVVGVAGELLERSKGRPRPEARGASDAEDLRAIIRELYGGVGQPSAPSPVDGPEAEAGDEAGGRRLRRVPRTSTCAGPMGAG